MRHLVGLVLALAAAAAVFFGGGSGVARLMAAHAHGTSLVSLSGGLTLAALVGTGLYLGLLVAVPAASPIGAGVPGLILLAWSGLDVLIGRVTSPMGLIGELLTRTYFESQGKAPYTVRATLNLEAPKNKRAA